MSDKEMKSEASNDEADMLDDKKSEADMLNDKKSEASTPKKRTRHATLDLATVRPYDIMKALKR